MKRVSAHTFSKPMIDMAKLTREAYEELRSVESERDINLKIGDMPQTFGDPLLIRQVLLNLLSNAMKFTRKRRAAVIIVGGNSRKSENVYFVWDNGTGFDMKFQEKLFSHRIHEEREFEGSGAALAEAKKIIEKQGGRVWAESRPDEGATFYFSLPAQSGQQSHTNAQIIHFNQQ